MNGINSYTGGTNINAGTLALGPRLIQLASRSWARSDLRLAATDAGLGAFITAAINEKPLEQALGLDPLREGALAVCGFGWRGDTMETMELDPNGAVWESEAIREAID